MKTVKLIEKEFPIKEVNLFAEYDMTFKYMKKEFRKKIEESLSSSQLKYKGLPKIHNLMYYPARIPPSATRAVTLASVLDYDPSIDKNLFLRAIGLENVKELSRRSGVLVTLYMADPDRELVRKMLRKDPTEITVVDPMAGGGSIPLESLRLGFRTIAGDYNPLAYLLLRATIEFPAKYGRKLLELVEEEARRLIKYVREELGRFYGEEEKNYIYFIGAEHDCGGLVPLTKHTLLSKKYNIHVKPVFDKETGKPRFEIVNKAPAVSTAVCPYCNKPMSEEFIRRKWIRKHVELLRELLNGNEEKAEEVVEVYIPVASQLGRGKYRPVNELDVARLIEASRELARCARREKKEGNDIRRYLPIAEIPADNEVFRKVREYGIKLWYQLFNPRQLLVLYKLIKYIRERAQRLYEQYGELGAAVVLYLALALAKLVNYSNILTQWHPGSEVIGALVGSQYALGRKARLGYDYIEAVPYITLSWALEATEEGGDEYEENDVESTRGGILPVLRLLCTRLEGLWKDGLDAVYLWDARELDKYLPEDSVDLINVDPPYYDQHDYAGISEFFWAIIQKALWSVLDVLFPRERVKLKNWRPEYPEIPKSIEIRGKPSKTPGSSTFSVKFKVFLDSASRVLKPDGLLVVWYAYGKLQGWEELFQKFYDAGYAVTKTWQVWTQSRQRRVALQRSAFFTSMVIVARPEMERIKLLKYNDPIFIEDVRRTVESTAEFILGTYGMDALSEAIVVSLADGYACATRYTLVGGLGSYKILTGVALSEAVKALINYLARSAGIKGLDVGALDNVSRLYTFLLIVSSEGLGVSSDFANRVAQVLKSNISLIRSGGGRGEIRLISPAEIAKKYPSSDIGKSIKLIEDVRRLLLQMGVRVAEDKVVESEQKVVALARLLVAVAWDKLGLRPDEKNMLLKILQGVI